MSSIIGRLLGLLSGPALDRVLSYLETSKNNETERLRIRETRQMNLDKLRAQRDLKKLEIEKEIVIGGRAFFIFWVAWTIAAIPTVAWYGFGMIDSMIDAGAILPDVAALPPQLKDYADIVFANIFYSGVAGIGVHALANATRRQR